MKILYLFLFFACAHPTSAQELLVNGGFEEVNVCTEYLARCAPEGWVSNGNGLSEYKKSAQSAHGGEYFYALAAGNHKRSFIRTPLLCGLQAGHQYQFTMQVRSGFSLLDSIGIYFTPYDFLYEQRSPRTIRPNVYLNDVTQFNMGDTGWQQVSWTYTAKGDESFLAIGNFATSAIDKDVRSRMTRLVAYVDDVSLMPIDPTEQLCSNWRQHAEDIYESNERHQYLDRLVKTNRGEDVPLVVLPKTVIQQNSTKAGRTHDVDTLSMPDIFFQPGKAVLQAASKSFLDSVVARVRNNTVDSVVVKGHTDNSGTFAFNRTLSTNRAVVVANYLQSLLPAGQRIFTYGYADLVPVANNDTPEGKRKNRRVEILIYFKKS